MNNPMTPLPSAAASTAWPARAPRSRWWGAALTGLGTLAVLWAVFQAYRAGQPLWAVMALVVGGTALYVYSVSRSLAWRYLFPGVAAMLVFIAFPLVYTVDIGFTNYSSNNLLTESRARAYLLEQSEAHEDATWTFTLHRDGSALYVALHTGEPTTARWITPALKLPDGSSLGALSTSKPVPLQPVDPSRPPKLGTALVLREVVALRDGLMPLVLQLPDGRALRYAGLREFAVFTPLWRAADQGAPSGALQRVSDGAVFAPNRDTGYFEDAQGQRLQPGFTVGVGLANFARLFGDADMRGPFVSIFIWTVAFAALTVLFSTVLGMSLAVVLNWEALRFRTLYRTLLFLPYAVPGFISILVFKGLFNQNFGEINAILDALFGIKPAWFADPNLARAMLLIVNTWLGYPYVMVLCTGLIKAIPADLYEASALAGAGPWTNFWRITAPLVAKPLTPLLISAFAYNFNNFVLISLLTDGRPDYLNTKLPAGTNDILVSYTYRIAFTDAGQNFGLAAAVSTVIFFFVALMSLANLRLTQRAFQTGRN